MSDEKLVEVNGQKMTEQQFQEKKKQIEGQPGTKLKEISPGMYRTILRG